MKKLFIINYSVKGIDTTIIERIKALGDWFNYFPGTFLVLSQSDEKTIYESIATNQSGDRFLVLEVDLKNFWGWLPPEAWEWLKNNKRPISR